MGVICLAIITLIVFAGLLVSGAISVVGLIRDRNIFSTLEFIGLLIPLIIVCILVIITLVFSYLALTGVIH